MKSNFEEFITLWDDYITNWFGESHEANSYMPEPWWGWCDNAKPLYGVVLNISPGEGGDEQKCDALKSSMQGISYSEAMRTGVLTQQLPVTYVWHNQRRAKPIITALGKVYSQHSIDNVLCIELNPFHSNDAKHKTYPKDKNFEISPKLAILAAAEAAQKIEGKLKGVVLVRYSADRFIGHLGRVRFKAEITASFNKYQIVKIKSENTEEDIALSDIECVCISGARNFLRESAINDFLNK